MCARRDTEMQKERRGRFRFGPVMLIDLSLSSFTHALNVNGLLFNRGKSLKRQQKT